MLRILIVDDHVVVDTESYRLPCFSVSIAASCMLVAHIDIGIRMPQAEPLSVVIL